MKKIARLLPRESRDTLFLLATIAAVVLPHASHLPLWASAIALLILLWRGLLAWRLQPLPGRWAVVGVLAVVIALTLITYRTLLGREAGITLVVMLMAMKTLELRARRDAFVVFFLGFFLVLTHFLFSQALLTALWMLISVWALLTALVLAQMPVGQPSLDLAAKQAARNTAFGLPVMVALFLLFPRIAPLWGVPSDSMGRTGLSNQLDFGAMSEIANDDSIAMRLRFADGAAPPPPQARYFRGPVLTRFDGRSWRASQRLMRGDALQVSGPALGYELTLEPLRIAVLPLLEMSPEPVGTEMQVNDLPLVRGPDLQWIAARPITERLRLNTRAYLNYQAGTQRNARSLAEELSLPARLNPRTRQWAQDLRAEPRFATLDEQALPRALADAVLKHIATQDYGYTLAPGPYGESTPDLIDEFWLDRRIGFCEHFAAAFVVVMRSMGVPARIVTGFQGMDAIPQDGYWIVRNSNAHAWAEYWVAGHGWLRADPTAAIAPERVSRGLALRPAPSALSQFSPALWARLRFGWEMLDNRWQQLVLNYSRQNQFDLLKSMGFAQPDWAALGQISAGLIVVLALISGAWSVWQSRPHDAWSRQRAKVLKALHGWGLEGAAAHQSPSRWAQLLQARHGAAAEAAVALLQSLETSRYAPAAQAQNWRERRRWWRAFAAAGRMLRHR